MFGEGTLEALGEATLSVLGVGTLEALGDGRFVGLGEGTNVLGAKTLDEGVFVVGLGISLIEGLV